MSRRGRTGPVISLFAFQDIITSVTAIVMVITLLLAVDLIQRRKSQAADSSGQIAAEIAERVQKVESELAALKDRTTETSELVREIAATSPAELRNEITQREAMITELSSEKERIQRRLLKVTELEKTTAVKLFDLHPVEEEKQKLERSYADLERQVQQERQENRVLFTLPRGFQKEGWIAVIEANRIITAPIGREAKPIEFRTSGISLFGRSSTKEFTNWIEQQGLRSAYFLLLVRPGAATSFDETDDALTNLAVSHGFDLISRDIILFHPERGAAP